MNLHAILNDRTRAIQFAAPADGPNLEVLARLPKGRPPTTTDPAPDDEGAVLAALGDGPLPPDVSILKHVKRDRDRESSGRKRTRRDRRARRARGLPR